jgi:hypothetical protein
MSAISQLKQASFAGIAFPYTDCRVSIVARHHAHVYIHTSGGELEKLGLALRKFAFTIPAHDTLQPPYRNFYSQVLPRLWDKWQSLVTADLVVPSVGTVQAMATDATRSIKLATSGEPVEVAFLEDSRTLETFAAVFTPSVSALPVQVRAVVRSAPVAVPVSLLDRLVAAVGQAMALAARGDTMARMWTAKITEVVNLCEAIYRTPALALPSSVACLDLLLELHLAAVKMREEAQGRSRPVLYWPTRTPARLAAGQIAAWIYGDTGRVGELLALNDWDPLNVPAGSIVRYYG